MISKEKIDKQLELEKQKEFKKMLEDRTIKANQLLKIKNSVVVDKSLSFFGVISIDKKNPKDIKYYAVMKKSTNDKFMCDCKDFAIQVDRNKDHKCKHIIRLDTAIKNKEKLEVIDLKGLKLLKEESM